MIESVTNSQFKYNANTHENWRFHNSVWHTHTPVISILTRSFFLSLSHSLCNNNQKKVRCVVHHTVFFLYFISKYIMREILLCYALFFIHPCQWTCDAGRECVYILSLYLLFNVQITYACYEVLKSKSLENMVTFGKCLEYIRKEFVRHAKNPLPREFEFHKFFHDAIRIGGKKCRLGGGRRKMDCFWANNQSRQISIGMSSGK